jgi:phospholipid transport system substrate-binding protein
MARNLIVRSRSNSGVIVLVGILLIWKPFSVSAGSSGDQVRATVENVVAILQDQRLKPEARQNQRQARLRQVIESNFDVEGMAKRALGSNWQGRSREQQDIFVNLFMNLLAATYLDNIEPYAGEKFLYLKETQEAGFSEVTTKVVDKKGEELAINYKLHPRNGNWKIYDLVIKNVSLVNNYRLQFNRILATTSFAELLERLQQKTVKWPAAERLRTETIIYYSIMSAAAFAAARPHLNSDMSTYPVNFVQSKNSRVVDRILVEGFPFIVALALAVIVIAELATCRRKRSRSGMDFRAVFDNKG